MKAKTKSCRAPLATTAAGITATPTTTTRTGHKRAPSKPKKTKSIKPEEQGEFPNGFVKTKDGKAIPIEKGPRGGLYYKKPKATKSTYLSAKNK